MPAFSGATQTETLLKPSFCATASRVTGRGERRSVPRQTDQRRSDEPSSCCGSSPRGIGCSSARALHARASLEVDKASANCGLVIPLMRKCRLFAARSARTDAFSLCAPASLPFIRRVSDEVSESGGPELLGRIPRRAVGGAGSFSASPSANSVGRRERGCLQVRTRSLACCLRCYWASGRAGACAGLYACESARWPRTRGGGTEGDRRLSGRGLGRHRPTLGKGRPLPVGPPPNSAHVGRG